MYLNYFILKNTYPKNELFMIFVKYNQRVNNKNFDVAQLLSPKFFGLISYFCDK